MDVHGYRVNHESLAHEDKERVSLRQNSKIIPCVKFVKLFLFLHEVKQPPAPGQERG